MQCNLHQENGDFVTFTEEILIGKLHFLFCIKKIRGLYQTMKFWAINASLVKMKYVFCFQLSFFLLLVKSNSFEYSLALRVQLYSSFELKCQRITKKERKRVLQFFRLCSLASVFMVGQLSFLFIFHFFHLDFLIHVFITAPVSVF